MLDNELLSEGGFDNALLENSVTAQSTAGRVYDYTNDRERTQDQQMGINMFYQNYSSKVTEDELRAIFNSENNGQLQRVFGSFDNYLAYMDERQDLIDAGVLDADWWSPDEALFDPSTLPPELVGDDQALEEYIRDLQVQAAQQGYQEQAILRETLLYKYTGIGGSTTWNQDGDKFEWNGTSWVQTSSAFGENWGSIVGEFVKSFIVSGASWAASTALVNLAMAGVAKYGSSALSSIKNAGETVFKGVEGVVDGWSVANGVDQAESWSSFVDSLSTVAGGVQAVGNTDWDPYDENQEYVDPNEEALSLYNMMLSGELPEGFSFTTDGNLNPGDGQVLDPATLIAVLWGLLKDLFKNENGEWEPPDNTGTGDNGGNNNPPQAGDPCGENGEGRLEEDENGELVCRMPNGGIDGNNNNTPPKVGDPCGDNGEGKYEEDANGNLYCKVPIINNGPQAGDPCGENNQGTYEPDGNGGLVCKMPVTGTNGPQAGDSCGPNGEGTYEDDGEGRLVCKFPVGPTPGPNPTPDPQVGDPCGENGEGTYEERGGQIVCVIPPTNTTNTGYEEGDSCGPNGAGTIVRNEETGELECQMPTTTTGTNPTSQVGQPCGPNGEGRVEEDENGELYCQMPQITTGTTPSSDNECDCGNGVKGTWNAEKEECECPSVITPTPPTPTDPIPDDSKCDCGNGVQGQVNPETGECDCPSIANPNTPNDPDDSTNTNPPVTTTTTPETPPGPSPLPTGGGPLAGGVNPTTATFGPLFPMLRGRGYQKKPKNYAPVGSIFGDISIEDILK